MWVDVVFLPKLHLSRASFREFYENKISHNCLTPKSSWFLMFSHFPDGEQHLHSCQQTQWGNVHIFGIHPSATPGFLLHPTTHKKHQNIKISVLGFPYLQTPLVTGNCWGDRKPGSLDGMENTGNILWILRPTEPCRAEFSHSHICSKTNPTDALNLQPHRAWCHPHFP